MTVWRLHLRPVELPARDVVEYCVRHKIFGLGWGAEMDQVEGETTDHYLVRHRQATSKRISAVHLMMRDVGVGDYIWVRAADGSFLLGLVTGDTKRQYGERHDLQDMYHVAPVEIVGDGKTGLIDNLEVPGSVKASFSARGHALQRIRNKSIEDYTDFLFKTKTGHETDLPRQDFIASLSAYELEDLAALYMQAKGWFVILSSHAPNTPRFEATFTNERGRTAGIQVKHLGWKKLEAASYAAIQDVDEVHLFAATGDYGTEKPPNVFTVPPEGLIAFARDNKELLPKTVRFWWDISKERVT